LSTIVTKILEFNTQVDQSLSLDVSQAAELKKVAEFLEQTTRYHSQVLQEAHFELFSRLFRWPEEQRFPVLDLFRVFLLHPSAAEHYARQGDAFLGALVTAGSLGLPDSSKAIQNNQMLALKCLVNLFKFESGRKLVSQGKKHVRSSWLLWEFTFLQQQQQQQQQLLERILSCSKSPRGPLRVAFSTLLVK